MFQWPADSLFHMIIKEYGVRPSDILPIIHRLKPCLYNVDHQSVFEFMMSIHFLVEKLCTIPEHERIEVVERLEREYGDTPDCKSEDHDVSHVVDEQVSSDQKDEPAQYHPPPNFTSVEQLIATNDLDSADVVEIPSCVYENYDELKLDESLHSDQNIQAVAVMKTNDNKSDQYTTKIVRSLYKRAEKCNPSVPPLRSNGTKRRRRISKRLRERSHMLMTNCGYQPPIEVIGLYDPRLCLDAARYPYEGRKPPKLNVRAFKHLSTLYPPDTLGNSGPAHSALNHFRAVMS